MVWLINQKNTCFVFIFYACLQKNVTRNRSGDPVENVSRISCPPLRKHYFALRRNISWRPRNEVDRWMDGCIHLPFRTKPVFSLSRVEGNCAVEAHHITSAVRDKLSWSNSYLIFPRWQMNGTILGGIIFAIIKLNPIPAQYSSHRPREETAAWAWFHQQRTRSRYDVGINVKRKSHR